MPDERKRKTIAVTVVISLVCSVLVSTAAVLLKPIQDKNRELDRKKNVLIAGGLYEKGADIESLFKKISPRVVDLQKGTIDKGMDPNTFDFKKIAKDPKSSRVLSADIDLAGLKRIPNFVLVYFLIEESEVKKIILPIYGKGLWSTLYGFIAIGKDLSTVKGFTFYEHGETPGLGGEVDNPRWKKIWNGKSIYDENGNLRIRVIKGKVLPSNPNAKYQVDGLSGATLTTRGVNNLVRFWLDKNGFGPFFSNIKKMAKDKINLDQL